MDSKQVVVTLLVCSMAGFCLGQNIAKEKEPGIISDRGGKKELQCYKSTESKFNDDSVIVECHPRGACFHIVDGKVDEGEGGFGVRISKGCLTIAQGAEENGVDKLNDNSYMYWCDQSLCNGVMLPKIFYRK